MTTPATRRKRAEWPKLLLDVRGTRVRTVGTMTTSLASIPGGTIGTIDGERSSWDKLCFKADACKCCGIAPRVNASWESFEVITTGEAS